MRGSRLRLKLRSRALGTAGKAIVSLENLYTETSTGFNVRTESRCLDLYAREVSECVREH